MMDIFQMLLMYLCENFPEIYIQERGHSVLFKLLPQLILRAMMWTRQHCFPLLREGKWSFKGLYKLPKVAQQTWNSNGCIFWNSHLTLSLEMTKCRCRKERRSPEQRWCWQLGNKGFVWVCPHIVFHPSPGEGSSSPGSHCSPGPSGANLTGTTGPVTGRMGQMWWPEPRAQRRSHKETQNLSGV